VLGVTLDLVREAMGGGFPPFLSTAFDVQHNGSTLAVSSSSELQVSPALSGAFAVRSNDSGDFEVCHD